MFQGFRGQFPVPVKPTYGRTWKGRTKGFKRGLEG